MEAQSESTAPRSSSTKLRYPLRSAGKIKEVTDSSAQKRVPKPSADLSKSVSVLELSGKPKPSITKPPRRLSTSVSTPNGSNGSIQPIKTPNSTLPNRSTKPLVKTPNGSNGSNLPVKTPKSAAPNGSNGSNLPAKALKLTTPNGSNGSKPPLKTPNLAQPNVPKSETVVLRKKFSIISSVSYWTTQIKLAESAGKDNVSLGFFKLAFESGCEPLDRMKEELKSYIVTHNLSNETSNSLNELLSLYNITEDLEQLKISNPKKSDSPKSIKSEKNGNSKNAPVMNSTVVKKSGNLKPRSLNVEKDGGNKIRVSVSNKNLVKNPKKVVKKEKKTEENNEEKENENNEENNMLVEESGSTDDIMHKQESSDKETNENLENAPSVELSSEEEKENTVDVQIVQVSEITLEA